MRRKPAGIRRKAEMKKGPVFGRIPFMATIAVPQKKKGETNTAHSCTCFINSSSNPGGPGVSSDAEHATSCPVPTQSTAEDEDEDESASSLVSPPVVQFAEKLMWGGLRL